MWDDVPDAGVVTVLAETISTMELAGSWAAAGLVRNETTQTVAGEIHAVLHDASGQELGRFVTELPVTAIRPGEPAPFLLRTDVPAHVVHEVVWDVRAAPATNGRGVIELMQWWHRPADQARPIDTYLHRESPDGPFPYALLGGASNLGDAVGPVDIVAAWLDDDGRVQWVASVALAEPTATRAAPSLEPRSAQLLEEAEVEVVDTPPVSEPAPVAPTTAVPPTTTLVPDEQQDPSEDGPFELTEDDGGRLRARVATTTTAVPSTTGVGPTAVSSGSAAARASSTGEFVLFGPRPDATAAAALAAGAQADFLFLVDAAVSRSFTGSVLLWAVPR